MRVFKNFVFLPELMKMTPEGPLRVKITESPLTGVPKNHFGGTLDHFWTIFLKIYRSHPNSPKSSFAPPLNCCNSTNSCTPLKKSDFVLNTIMAHGKSLGKCSVIPETWKLSISEDLLINLHYMNNNFSTSNKWKSHNYQQVVLKNSCSDIIVCKYVEIIEVDIVMDEWQMFFVSNQSYFHGHPYARYNDLRQCKVVKTVEYYNDEYI